MRQRSNTFDSAQPGRYRSRELFQAIFEQMSDGIIISDAQGRYLDANPQGCAMLGYSHAELLQLSWQEVAPAAQPHAAINGSAPSHILMQHKNGQALPLKISHQRLSDGAQLTFIRDDPVPSAASALDGQHYRTLFQQSPYGMMVVDPATQKAFDFNNAMCDQLGYSRAEFAQQTISDFEAAEQADETRKHIEEIMRTGKHSFETLHRNKSGQVRPMLVDAQALTLDGRSCMYVVVRDISEHKQSEAALRDLASDLAMAQRIAHVGSWSVELDANLALTDTAQLSEECARLFGLAPGTAAASIETLLERIHPDDRRQFLPDLASLMQPGAEFASTYRLLLPDDTLRSMDGRVVVVFDRSNGLPLKLVGTSHDVTEQRRAEQQLRESEELLRVVTERARVGLVIFDHQKRYHYVNQSYAELLEQTIDGLLGRNISEILSHDYMTSIRPYLDRAYAGEPLSYERRVRTPSGIYRHIMVSYEPLNAQHQTYIMAVITDISEQIQREEALRKREHSLARAQQIAHMGDWEEDPISKELYWSPEVYRIFDRSPQSFKPSSTTFFEAVYPDDVDAVRQTFLRAIKLGIPSAVEHRIVRGDGAVRHVHQEIEFVDDEVAHTKRMLGTVQDITERKLIEIELRRSEERFAKIFNASPAPMSLTHVATYTLVDVNASYESAVGYTRDQLIGKSAADMNIFASLEEQTRLLSLLKAQRSLRNFECTVKTHAGELRQMLYSGEIFDLGGSDHALSIVIDITERKRAEEELKQMTAELARSNAELEQYAYIASHDLQEPLRAVTSMLQLLQRRSAGLLDERSNEFIGHAIDGALRMQTLINDLLAFSRVGTRGQPFKRIDLATSLGAALANLTLVIQESGATITHDPLPSIVADPTQITQLWQNLIGNAIKFRSSAAPIIHIAVAHSEGAWNFAVRDNGIGIDPQYFERIFQLFQRLHTRRVYPGTGIGLALCKKIVERHGGYIWVESTPGQGSSFCFQLPNKVSVA